MSQPCIIIDSNDFYGAVGKIVKIDKRQQRIMSEVVFEPSKPVNCLSDYFFTQVIAKQSKVFRRRWCSFDQLSGMVRRDPGMLSKLVSSIYVEVRDEKAKEPRVFDLGLRLRNKNRKLHVPYLVTYYEVE